MGWMVGSLNSGRGKKFSSLHNHPERHKAHHATYLMGTNILLRGEGGRGRARGLQLASI